MGQTNSINPLDALAPVVNPLDALAPVKKKPTAGTESATAEFLRRMLTQVVSPVDPLHKLGKAAGDVIEGVARPSTDSSIGNTIKQAAESIKADPIKGTAKTAGMAALGMTGIPSIAEYLQQAVGAIGDLNTPDAYSPAARVAQGLPAEPTAAERIKERLTKGATMARGYGAGVVEGVSSMSPLDALLLKAGAKNTPEGLPGKFKWRNERPGGPGGGGGSADLRAQQGGTILSKGGTVVKGREAGGVGETPVGDVVNADTIREALKKVADKSRPERTFMSPAEPPPEPVTMGRDAAGKPLPEPGSGSTKFDAQTTYTPEERELLKQPYPEFVPERAKQAEVANRPVRAARNAAIDKAHADTVREIEKRLREGGGGEALDLPAEGTTRGEAYAAGATPAEAGTAAAKARAEGTAAATDATVDKPTGAKVEKPTPAAPDKPVKLPSGTDIHSVLQSVEQSAIERIKARGTFKGSRLGSGLPVDDLLDLATIGATKIARGTLKFADWSVSMTAAIGDEIRPHLQEIWAKAQDIHTKHLAQLVPKGRAPLPQLPRMGAKSTTPAAPKKIASSGQLKDALSRTRILKELGGLKVDDPGLAKKIARFKYLSDQNYQEGAAARTVELGNLEKEILAHPGLPTKLKERWTKLGTALPDKSPTTQAERNAAAKAEASVEKPARLDPKAIEAGRALEARIRESAATPEPAPAPKLIPDEPLTQRSAALAESLAKDVPALALKPIAPIPPEASSSAVGESLARSFSSSSLHGLLEQIRVAVGGGAGNEPGVREVLKQFGQEGELTPTAKALVDTIESHIAEAGSDLSMDRLKRAQDKDRLFTSHRPPTASTIRVPEPRRAIIDIPMAERAHYPRGYGSNEAKAWRSLSERLKASAEAKKTAERTNVPAVRSIEDIGNLGKGSVPATPASRPRTLMEHKAAERVAAGELARPEPPREIGPPPPGVEPELWASINALETEGLALQERGITDPRIVHAMRTFWGSEEAAARLGLTKPGNTPAIRAANKAAVNLVKEVSGAPKRVPLTKVLEESDARFRHLIDDPHGFMRIESILAGFGAAAGATAGATLGGEDVMDHLAYGLSGAIIGGLAGYAGGKGVQYLGDVYSKPRTRAHLAATAELVDSANLLAGPAIIKSSFGSMGGVAAGLAEKRYTNPAGAARALDYITGMGRNGMVAEFFKILTGPIDKIRPASSASYATTVGTKIGFVTPNNVMTRAARQVLRPFIAGDAVSSKALQLMGFTKKESMLLQLQGEPTSWLGQTVNRAVQNSFALRMMVKFPAVRVNSIERGIEYTPGLNRLINTRHTKAQTPRYFRGSFQPQEGLTKEALKYRGRIGGAAMVAGTAYGYIMDPSLQHAGVVASAAGPAFLPVATGMAIGTGINHNKDLLQEALLSLASSVPQIQEADVRVSSLKRRFTPFGPALRAIERMQGK